MTIGTEFGSFAAGMFPSGGLIVNRGRNSFLTIISFALLMNAPAALAAADTPDSSFIVGGPFPVPLYRLHGDDPLPVCNASINGATALLPDGTLCVCKTGSGGGGAWLLAVAGTACERQ